MAEASVPVDLANPGQVFACLGFLEAAEALLGGARGGFDWRDPGNLRFRLAARGGDHPVLRVLRFLDEATVTCLVPAEASHSIDKWKIRVEQDASGAFPYRYTGPDVLPARLRDRAGMCITIDHWGDRGGTVGDRVKFWAGMQGKPGARLAQEALDLIRGQAADHADDPFSLGAGQSGSFRFDWRRDYIPVDAGFSPNQHRSSVVMRGYPVVELLAAVGLTHARPIRRSRLEYRYGVVGLAGDALYDPIFVRAALGVERPLAPGMPFRAFTMRLGWPAQEGHARCITDVIEETLTP
ncbi:MAG: type I-U CRISPR-associated protein Cas8c [Rhodospirillales bacterium]|nr:type I-U CRISPR-associated protein Cas8c [Rhodospirillales bacterium]